MLFIIFISLYFSSLLYVFLKKRKIDFFTLMVFSLSYYGSPLIFKEITIDGVIEQMPISTTIYIVYIYIYAINLLFMIANDRHSFSVKSKLSFNGSTDFKILLLVTIVFFSVGVYGTGVNNYFLGSKKDGNDLDPFLAVSVWCALSLFSLVYSDYVRNKLALFFSVFVVVSFLLYGSRANTVILFLMFALLFFDFKETRLVYKIHYFLLGFSFVYCMIAFKKVYWMLKSENTEVILARITSIDSDQSFKLLMADPLAVIYNFNLVVVNGLSLPVDYFFHRVFSVVPFLSTVFSEINNFNYLKFSEILHDNYHNVSWGLASTSMGEVLAVTNYFGLFVFLSVWVFSIYRFNVSFSRKDTFAVRLFFPVFVYSIFYIHRVDVTFVLGAIKVSIFIWLLARSCSALLVCMNEKKLKY